MLTREENEILTQVGPGTLMGNLLRRYWTPACLSREIEADGAPLEVRLLGEDLIAFRDSDGKVGLVDRACPHRGASLFYGRNEECGLRCIYHGWKFDVDGNCVDMPNEPRPFADRIKLGSYPVHESGGIIWTYMGPRETITPFRNFGTDDLAKEDFYATKILSTCNWVQSLEGGIDPSHVSFLHMFFGTEDIPNDGTDRPGYPSNAMTWKFWQTDRRPRVEVEDEWYGFRYISRRTTPNGHEDVRVSAYVIPTLTFVAAIPFSNIVALTIPIDDENSWRYTTAVHPYSNPHHHGGAPLFVYVPFKVPPTVDEATLSTGLRRRDYTAENRYRLEREAQAESFSGITDFTAQDLAASETPGAISDRRLEHLGNGDSAIVRMRSVLLEAAKAVERGDHPPAVSADLDYRSIRGASKILRPDEDWHVLGTDADPAIVEALLARRDPNAW